MGRLAQLQARDLERLLDPGEAGREVLREGVRLVYDGAAFAMSGAAAPDVVLATAQSTGQEVAGFGCDWEVTMYLASVDTTRAWMRMLEAEGFGEQQVGLSPFWAGGDLRIVFTTGGEQGAFPVIACPTAPASAQPGAGGARSADR